ncbi:hypothetical protein PVAND_016468 [Polypedilum vanderplanki]|uniref:Uncharacterized protein n=1 Tax=Polypedilum vanderplanki TaxID=319348 RepID=A0A9J6BF62_POLVA|nr:hypothetical protein PVAND_016468 [Polypedilum vanderplanki]
MSSKRKSPPTKLDGTNGNGITDLSIHSPDIHHLNNHQLHPTHHLDLSIKTETNENIESRTSPQNFQINGDRHIAKRNFHEPSHSLQNILSKRRKSENFTNDNVPSLNSSPNHHHELASNYRIKREQNGSDGEFDSGAYGNNNNNHGEKELLVQSKKTMNDVLKLLTNKMRGSTLKDGRKSSVDGEGGDGKSESPFDPIKLFNQVEIPENLQEREKYFLYSEMILQLQMARDHILRQQPEKAVS